MPRYRVELIASGVRFSVPGLGDSMCVLSLVLDTGISAVSELLSRIEFPDAAINEFIDKFKGESKVVAVYANEEHYVSLKIGIINGELCSFGRIV